MNRSMRRLRLTDARRRAFLRALAETGNVTAAVEAAGTSRSRVYELRKADPPFALAWEEAEETAADALEAEARRRAVIGVLEPVVSAGKVVRDDDGQPIAIRRYSDALLLALLRAHRPQRRGKVMRFQLPTLKSPADAAGAMAAITAGIAEGDLTPAEASELAKIIEAYLKALEVGEFDLRLRAVEARSGAQRP
jgi:hypothetical protein